MARNRSFPFLTSFGSSAQPSKTFSLRWIPRRGSQPDVPQSLSSPLPLPPRRPPQATDRSTLEGRIPTLFAQSPALSTTFATA